MIDNVYVGVVMQTAGSNLALQVVFGVVSESNMLKSANGHLYGLKQPLNSLKGFYRWGFCFILVYVAWKGKGRQNGL